MSTALATIIMAAGKGKRMKSDLPKVLHQLAGKPLIQHVIELAFRSGSDRVILVVGHGREEVRSATRDMKVDWVVQEHQLGTGDAVKSCAPMLASFTGDLLILSGDVPMLRSKTVLKALELHRQSKSTATVFTFKPVDPEGYGRIVRDSNGNLQRIVEQKDATIAEQQINEVNGGVYIFSSPVLFPLLERIDNSNASGEYYLPDCIGLMAEQGDMMAAYLVEDDLELAGVNDPSQLANLEANFIEMRVD